MGKDDLSAGVAAIVLSTTNATPNVFICTESKLSIRANILCACFAAWQAAQSVHVLHLPLPLAMSRLAGWRLSLCRWRRMGFGSNEAQLCARFVREFVYSMCAHICMCA